MPFLGLLDTDKIEITAPGYVRLDLSAFDFRMSPPRTDRHHFCMINANTIKWHAKAKWRRVCYVAVYSDVMDGEPLQVVMMNQSHQVYCNDILQMVPGQLTLDSKFMELIKVESS